MSEAELTPGEEIKQQWMQARLGHEAMCLDNLQRGARIVERLALKRQNGTIGRADPGLEEFDKSLGDDMGVSIGNRTVHNHYPPAAVKPSFRSGWGLKKLALWAALLAAGGGTGAALPWLLEPLQPGPAVAPPQRADRDTLFELRFGDPFEPAE